MQKYQRAKEVATNIFNSRAFSTEEVEAIKDARKLDPDEMIYVMIWMKGAALASRIVSDFQKDLK